MSENNSEEIINNSEEDINEEEPNEEEDDEQQEYDNNYIEQQEEEEERFQMYISLLQNDEEEEQQNEEEQQQNDEEDDFYDRIVERFIIDLFSPQPLVPETTSSDSTTIRLRYIQNPLFSYSRNTTWTYQNQERENDYTYNSDGFILNSFFQSFSDPIESVLMESLNQQPGLERTFEKLEIDSQLYSSTMLIDKNETDKNCCICLSDFKSDDNVSVLNCKHLFHHDCIVEWSMYKINCPVCRENLKQE